MQEIETVRGNKSGISRNDIGSFCWEHLKQNLLALLARAMHVCDVSTPDWLFSDLHMLLTGLLPTVMKIIFEILQLGIMLCNICRGQF